MTISKSEFPKLDLQRRGTYTDLLLMKAYLICIFACLLWTSVGRSEVELTLPDIEGEPSLSKSADNEAQAKQELQTERTRTAGQHALASAQLNKADKQSAEAKQEIAKIQIEIKKQQRLRMTYEAELKAASQKQVKAQQEVLVARQNYEAAKQETAQAVNARNVALKLAQQARIEAQQFKQQTAVAKKQTAVAQQPIGNSRVPASRTGY